MENIKRTFAKYVSLNIIGMIGISCYILADTFFVAQGVGTLGLAALNFAIPVYSIIHAIGLMVGMGGATRYSLSGTKDVFLQSLYMILAASVIFLIMSKFSEPVAYFLGADADAIDNTSTYVKIMFLFSPMFMLNNCLVCFVRNDGNPKLSMVSMFVGSVSNIILDYVFIFPCGMGMLGAAVATGISPVVGVSILSWHFIKGKNTFGIRRVKPRFNAFRDISSIGVSTFITELSVGIVMVVFNIVIMRIAGNSGVAAYGVVANIALVFTSVFTGIAQGMQPIVSQSYAKADKDSIKKVLRYGIITTLVFCVCIYSLSFIFAEPIVALFNSENDAALGEIAKAGMRLYFISLFFSGVNIVITIFFSALGRAKDSFIVSILRGIAVIIPVTVIMSYIFGMNGVWLSAAVAEAIVTCSVLLGKKVDIFVK